MEAGYMKTEWKMRGWSWVWGHTSAVDRRNLEKELIWGKKWVFWARRIVKRQDSLQNWVWAGPRLLRCLWLCGQTQCLGRPFDKNEPQIRSIWSVVTRLPWKLKFRARHCTFLPRSSCNMLWLEWGKAMLTDLFSGNIFYYSASYFNNTLEASAFKKTPHSGPGIAHANGMVEATFS